MNYAIILSGGVGTRMRSDGYPKQYLEVGGKPILLYALEPFVACPDIDEIVIVADPVWQDPIREWVQNAGIEKPVTLTGNGNTRQESILNGLLHCASRHPIDARDNVLIHEAVRPLVTRKIVEDCVQALKDHECALPVIPVHDTMYVSYDKKMVARMANRDELFCGQAPEGFRLKTYLELNQSCTQDELASIRGSSELLYRKGHSIAFIDGDPINFKLTRPGDLELFKAYLALRT